MKKVTGGRGAGAGGAGGGGHRVAGVAIVDVRTQRISAPLHTPFVTSLRTATSVETVVVEIVDEDGRVGFGEAPQVWQVTGASLAGFAGVRDRDAGSAAGGRDPDDLVANCQTVAGAVVGNEAAKAAVDVALHDLAARRLGVPLARLLGGTAKPVPTDVTLSAAGDRGAGRRRDRPGGATASTCSN